MPHLVQVHEKYGSRGFNIVWVSSEAGGKVDGFLKDEKWKSINYLVGVANGSVAKSYGVTGIPAGFLIGPDGKYIREARSVGDSEIETMVSKLAPKTVGREVAREVRKAAGNYDKGDFAGALKDVEKFFEEGAAEKYSEEVRKDAEFIKGLVEKQVEANTARLNEAVSAKEWLEVQAMVPDLKKSFKGMPILDRVKEVETELKSKEVRAEISALTQFEKLAEEYRRASNDRAKEAMKAKITAFIKANEGTKAAEKAAALIAG